MGTCSNLGGLGLHQGVLDYTTDLYHHQFIPLRRYKAPGSTLRGKVRLLGKIVLVSAMLVGANSAWKVLGLPAYGQLFRGKRGRKAGGKPGMTGEFLSGAQRTLSGIPHAITHLPAAGVGAVKGAVSQIAKIGSKAEHEVGHVAEAIGEAEPPSEVHGAVEPPPGPLKRARQRIIGGTFGLLGRATKPIAGAVQHTVSRSVAEKMGAF